MKSDLTNSVTYQGLWHVESQAGLRSGSWCSVTLSPLEPVVAAGREASGGEGERHLAGPSGLERRQVCG